MHTHQPYGRAQYYIGRYENERFHPETYGRLSHLGSLLAGPETLIDDKGRRLFWGWIREARDWSDHGWSGVMSLPWHLTPAPDNTLRIDPVQELRNLRYDEQHHPDVTLSPGEERTLHGFNPTAPKSHSPSIPTRPPASASSSAAHPTARKKPSSPTTPTTSTSSSTSTVPASTQTSPTAATPATPPVPPASKSSPSPSSPTNPSTSTASSTAPSSNSSSTPASASSNASTPPAPTAPTTNSSPVTPPSPPRTSSNTKWTPPTPGNPASQRYLAHRLEVVPTMPTTKSRTTT